LNGIFGTSRYLNYADAVTVARWSLSGPGEAGAGGLLALGGGRSVGIVAAPEELGSGDFTDATVAPWELLQTQQRWSKVRGLLLCEKGR